MTPTDAADGAEFINVTSWQGGGLVIAELEPTGSPGVFTTDEPVPVGGSWKTMVRYSSGNTLNAMPIYMPEDPAIPVEGVPAEPAFERTFQCRPRGPPARAEGRRELASTIVAYLVVAAHRVRSPRDDRLGASSPRDRRRGAREQEQEAPARKHGAHRDRARGDRMSAASPSSPTTASSSRRSRS